MLKMAQKKIIYKGYVKQVGYWKYIDLYDMLFNWLKDNGYDLSEDSYTEKLQGGGKEILIKWTAVRKVTDYFMYEIKLDWHILGMKDAEAEIDGKKVNTNKGEVKIEFKGNLINDYEKKWEDKPSWKFLRSLYEKYVIRKTIDEYEDDLEDETKELISDAKAFLKIPAR